MYTFDLTGSARTFSRDGKSLSDGVTHYLARMNRDGSGPSKVAPYPIGNIGAISPLPNGSQVPAGNTEGVAVPVNGVRRIGFA